MKKSEVKAAHASSVAAWVGWFGTKEAIAGFAFCLGVAFGTVIVQSRLSPAWNVLSGVEMHLLHTDFTPNFPMQHKYALFSNNPSAMPIVMAGDSLTDYGEWHELLRRPDVGNRGITGDTASGLLERADMLAKPGATVAVMIGANDLIQHRSATETCERIAQILERLKAEHRVVLQSTLLTARPTLNARIKDLDECERHVCETRERCTFLDLNSQLAPTGALENALTFDGSHLNHEGYVRWAAALGPLLVKVAN